MVELPSLPPSVTTTNSTPLTLNTNLPQSFTVDNSSLFGNVMSFSSLVKLDRNNFLWWKFVIILAVKWYDLDGYLFGTQPIPENMTFTMEKYSETKFIFNPVYVKYAWIDKRLLCWLLSSISKSVLPKVVGLSTTHETWKTLEMVYASQACSRVLQLKT